MIRVKKKKKKLKNDFYFTYISIFCPKAIFQESFWDGCQIEASAFKKNEEAIKVIGNNKNFISK